MEMEAFEVTKKDVSNSMSQPLLKMIYVFL